MKITFAIVLLLAAYLCPGLASAACTQESGVLVCTGTGTNDNDVLFETGPLLAYDKCTVMSTVGAVDVWAAAGTAYATSAYSLQDFGSTTPSTDVLVTAALRWYGFVVKGNKLKVLQNGATGATAYLFCWK